MNSVYKVIPVMVLPVVQQLVITLHDLKTFEQLLA
jgi:hypothetical protein